MSRILLCLLLAGCAISPTTERAMKVVDQQACVQRTGSFLQCPHEDATIH